MPLQAYLAARLRVGVAKAAYVGIDGRTHVGPI